MLGNVQQSIVLVLVCSGILFCDHAAAQRTQQVPVPEFPFLPPESVSIFPVFFVAADQPNPPAAEGELLMRHVKWAQQWFKSELNGRSTFRIYADQPYLFRGRHPLAHYVAQEPGKRAPLHLNELLEHFQLTRFNCPFVFVTILDNLDERPNGGRPINSGFNSGGGIVQMARRGLVAGGTFQGVLRHELGHSFGLQHVTLYGYDMKTNMSIMSYNNAARARAFKESRTPAVLIPEDIRALALNDRVFPNLTFDEKRHLPRGYLISDQMRAFTPIPLPGRPQDRIEIVSLSGEAVGSFARNLVRRKIVPNVPSETNKQGINYNKKSMWHSDDTGTEWRTLEITFPVETKLTGVRIHSQHSGRIHPVKEFRASTVATDGDEVVVTSSVKADNQLITFPAASGRRWKLDFKPSKTKKVALRGLQFYYNETELYAAVTSDEDAEPVEAK